MKAFWHSSSWIEDPAILARLALAFDAVVTPSDGAPGCLRHNALIIPDMPPTKYWRAHPFAPSSVRHDPVFYPRSAYPDYEAAYEKFGQEFADAQYELLEVKNRRFDNFVRTAALNGGILIGDTDIADEDFALWLSSTSDSAQSRAYVIRAALTLAGVEIALPQVTDAAAKALDHLNERYAEELMDYRAYIDELTSGAWSVITADTSLSGLRSWAEFIAETKIQPALRRVERAIALGQRGLLAGIGQDMVADIPKIVTGRLHEAGASLTLTALESLLRVLAPKLAASIRERRVLESTFGLAYLYRMKKVAGRQH